MAVLIANCKKCAVVEMVGDASHPVNTGELVQQVEKQLVELDTLLAGREHIDADDFTLYLSLRMLSVVKGVNYPANVKQYMARLEQATGVPLHWDQAS